MSPDLRLAKVYIAPPLLPQESDVNFISILQEERPRVRKALGCVLKMKFTPEIRFFEDETLLQAMKIEALFNDEKVKRDIQA
jgi:ribosome-binding factor A